MLRAGLIGQNIARSLSPILHRAAAKSIGMTADYALFDLPPERLEGWLAKEAQTLDGFNVTAPYKVAVFEQLSHENPRFYTELDATALKAGAVNTVKIEPGPKLVGYNTDLEGVRAAIDALWPISGSHAVLLGAGGAARAVLAALVERDLQVTVLARNRDAAELLAAVHGGVKAENLAQFQQVAKSAAIVINCLPPAADGFFETLSFLPADACCLDLGYGSRPFLKQAQLRGLRCEDGLRFLWAQGIASFLIWTGQTPNRDAVWKALQEAQLRALQATS